MDTEYILDCAFELAEVTPVEHAVLSSPRGAYWTVQAAVDANQNMPEHFLQNTARDHLDTRTSLAERYFFALCALQTIDDALRLFSERAAHLVQTNLQHALGLQLPPMLEGLAGDAIASPGAVMAIRESDIGEGLVRQVLNQQLGSAVQRWTRDLQLMDEAAAWYQADSGATFKQMLVTDELPKFEGVNMAEVSRAANQRAQAAVHRANRSLKTKARAAIKKATRLFQNLGQEENLRMFISGAEVTLAHPRSPLKFVLKPAQVEGWLVDRTARGQAHAPYEVSLYTKEDVYLAKLCVYFAATPVLDQLLAMTLFVTAGDELQLLKTANWYAMEDWGPAKEQLVLQAHPQLTSKFTRKQLEQSGRWGVQLDAVFIQMEDHWAPFKGRVEQWISTWMAPAVEAARNTALIRAAVTRQTLDRAQTRHLTLALRPITAASLVA